MPREETRSRGGFKYRHRSKEQYKARATQKGGAYDSYFEDGFKIFKPAEGDNELRFMPPTWKDPEPDHFGFDIWVHGQVGPDNQQYLCPEKMKGEPCPICEEQVRAAKKAKPKDKKAQEYVRSLKPKRKVLCWVIVRGEEKEGPQLWPMPWTLDRNFGKRAVDKKTDEVLELDNPDEGYDVSFERQGTRLNTEYLNEQVARNATPLSDNSKRQARWLAYIEEHPVTETLQYYDYDYIDKVFSAQAPGKDEDEEDDEEDEEEAPSRRKGKGRRDSEEEEDSEDEEEETPPKRKGKGKAPIDDEDEDLDEDDDGEEDRPSRRKGKAKDSDDEDDSDEEEEDEEEEEEEEATPPKRKKGKPEEDEEEEESEDDDSEDDDEEEEPPKRRRKVKEEESDEDDDSEDEEDDEPPPKRKAKPKAKGKPAKGKAKDSDDDEESEDDEDDAPPRRKGKTQDDDIPF